MTKARRDGLSLVLVGGIVFLLLGTVLANTSKAELVDFRVLYYPARCLLHHGDPYSENEVLDIARAEGGERPADIARASHFARYIYPPSTFSLTVPFAFLPWRISHAVWMALTGGGLIFGALLMWTLGADYSPVISGALIGFLLCNSELLMVLGNSAGIAIALCVVAVWCFLRDRFVVSGVFCLAISLAFKPHDTGLVWLYFLLAGGVYRKRALQTLVTAFALSLPGVLWVWYVVPNWVRELRSNLLAFSVRGGLTDPGFAPAGGHGLGMMVNLQTVFSAFWSDPRAYNAAVYVVCGPLFLIWIIAAARSRFSAAGAWLALASIAALSMLPVYHRQYDTKVLLLTVPACTMLWAEGGVIGWFALLVNTAGFVLTGDLSWMALLGIIKWLFPLGTKLSERVLVDTQVFSVPLTLLVMGVFYLWVYVRRCSAHDSPEALPGPVEGPRTGLDENSRTSPG